MTEPRPLVTSSSALRSALRPALAPVAAAYAVSLVCVTVVVLLLGDDRGGPLDHLRGACLVLGASLRAWVFTSFGTDEGSEGFVGVVRGDDEEDLDEGFGSGDASLAYLFVPLLITGVLLGLTARQSRRAELAQPSGDGQRLAVGAAVTAATGLAGVVAVTLLARTGDVFGAVDDGSVDGEVTGSVTYGVELASLLLWGFPLLLLAGLAGRLSAWVPRTRGVPLMAEAGRVTSGVSGWVGVGGVHAVLTGCLGTALVVLPYLAHQTQGVDGEPGRSDLLGGAVLALLLAPTYVLAVAGLGMGIQGGLGSGFGGGDRFGLLSDPVDDRFLLGLLVPVAVSVLLGARQALRTDPAAPLGGEVWRAAAGFAAFWVLIGFVLVAGTRTDLLGSIELVVRAEPITLVLVPAVWGALTVVLGRAVARSLTPRPAGRLAGAGLHAGWR